MFFKLDNSKLLSRAVLIMLTILQLQNTEQQSFRDLTLQLNFIDYVTRDYTNKNIQRNKFFSSKNKEQKIFKYFWNGIKEHVKFIK